MSWRGKKSVSRGRYKIEQFRLTPEEHRDMDKRGSYSMIDDLDGLRYKSEEMTTATGRSRGLAVSQQSLEEFDAQLNIETPPDDQTVPISRPRINQDC